MTVAFSFWGVVAAATWRWRPRRRELAIGVDWSRNAKWKRATNSCANWRAMDPNRHEKMLSRLDPKLAIEIREQLMERFQM